MRHLKSYNESISKLPKYVKGEVLVFPVDKYLYHSNHTIDATAMASELGYEVMEVDPETKRAWDYAENAIHVKCDPGKEDQCGQDFIDNYPEFFGSYERRDIRDEVMQKNLDYAIKLVSGLDGRKFIPDGWNADIDEMSPFGPLDPLI